jgi:segregation and condensation protein A
VHNERSELSKPPLNVLVNPESINRKKPWEVNLKHLLEIFLRILEQEDIPDLRLCGSAAFSSALIYRMKVESLFLFEKIQVKRRVFSRIEPPRIINLPYRYELSTTSLDDLVEVLENILEDMMSKKEEKKPSVIESEPVLEVDTFSVQIQKSLKEFKRNIINILKYKKEIIFSEYVKGLDTISTLRSLLLFLFTANDGVVTLIQDDDDIRIIGETSIDR